MSEVPMKTVTVGWTEYVYYTTTMEVPADFTTEQIEDAFWAMDLSNEKPVETDFARVDYIEDAVS